MTTSEGLNRVFDKRLEINVSCRVLPMESTWSGAVVRATDTEWDDVDWSDDSVAFPSVVSALELDAGVTCNLWVTNVMVTAVFDSVELVNVVVVDVPTARLIRRLSEYQITQQTAFAVAEQQTLLKFETQWSAFNQDELSY